MTEPKGCPTPGACSAVAQIAELTKERDHWHRAFRNITAAGDTLLEIERQRVRDALENSARLIEERNEWRRIATDNLSALQTATARIAAAQAREEKLREAIAYVAPMYYDVDIIEKALVLSIDTSALDARLEQERERCAKELESLDHMNFHRAAYYIRAMK